MNLVLSLSASQSTPSHLKINLGHISPLKMKRLFKMPKTSSAVSKDVNYIGTVLKMRRNSAYAAPHLSMPQKTVTQFRVEEENLLRVLPPLLIEDMVMMYRIRVVDNTTLATTTMHLTIVANRILDHDQEIAAITITITTITTAINITKNLTL